jgi:acyl-CoA reductase-like NAD-dependent aldehyde dehydrogenase
MEERREHLALQIAREGGKPLPDAIVETTRAIDGVHNAADELRTFAGREIPMGLSAAAENRWAFTTREPIGIVAAISAFNHPLNLIVHQVAPAIAVGCPVIVKPASTTPLSCLDLVALVHEAGLPEPWCQSFVPEGNDLAERLATDRRVAFLSFIGSARVGWSLHAKLAPGTRSALEHGGAAPAIVDRSADLGRVIEPIVKGGYYHAGQVCVSTQRIFVHGDIADDFTQRLVARVDTLRTADPVQKDTEVGPLILPREADRVAEWVEEAVEGGATLATGGRRLSETTLEPAVLLDPGRHEDFHAGDLRSGGRGVSLPRSRRGDRARERPADGLPGQRLCAGHRRRDARSRSSRRLGRDDQRSHRLPDRLDAFRRAPGIRLRHRRHPLHDARPGTGEDDPDAEELMRAGG